MGWGSRRVFLTQAGAGLALSACLSGKARAHVAVFDAMWEAVDEWYFDPAMNGIDWPAVRREWRPKAAQAETPAALYLDVLVPLLDRFRTSHIEIRPPGVLALANGRSFRMPRQKRGASIVMLTGEDEAGMGAVLTWTGAAYLVEDVALAGPAHAAGLRPGQSVRLAGFSLPDDRREIQLIERGGARFTVKWTPKVAEPQTDWSTLAERGYRLRFDAFDQASIAWAIERLGAAAVQPVVLDLRTNTGGLIVEMWRLLSTILPGGSDIGRFQDRKRTYEPETAPLATWFTGPLAVLIGPKTSSAGEITTAVLQHHGRARLFGARTSGSVLASRIFDLPDGGKLTIPYADYLSPAGTRIEDQGVHPDVVAPRTILSMTKGRDPALDAAADWFRRRQ